jgi:2-(1,2-epoxy-1,2-dihydrophenyl)acetyl-CoA isomerase
MGCGSTFSAGGDIKAMQAEISRAEMSRADVEAKMRRLHETLVMPLAMLAKPTVAAVNGVAAGAGIGIALACDFRVVSRDAYFLFAFHRLALVPDFAMWWTLPRLVGLARAKELAFLKSRLSAEEAESWGLVTELCDQDDVRDRALLMATGLAAGPPVAMEMTKQMLEQGARLDLRQALEIEAVNQATARETDDHLAAVQAFIEKRSPAFGGR